MTRMFLASNRLWIGAIIAILAIFVVLSLLAFDAPGLYMDSVNPDFEVVRILHPDAPIVTWEMPGDFLFQRFPVLLGLYAGSIAAYWAIPFYLIFGGTVLSIRVSHLCLGLLILAVVAIVSRDLTRSALISAIVVLLLAVDPAFIYVFRTQGNVQMFGLLFLLGAIVTLHRYPKSRGQMAAGVLAGLAVWSYFVYLFALPGLIVYLFVDREVSDRRKALSLFAVGLAFGIAPYLLGYGLLFGTLGFSGGSTWLHNAISGLHVGGSQPSYLARVASTAFLVGVDLSDEWQWLTFWKEAHSDFGQVAKSFVLVATSLLGFLLLRRDCASRAFAAAAFPTLSFVLFATYFGARLGGHDLTAIVTLSYLCAAVSLSLVLAEFARFRKAIVGVCGGVATLLLIANAEATTTVAKKLAREGGVGLYSQSISLFPQSVLAKRDPTPIVFWDWGEMMPFIYETGGAIPVSTGDQTAAVVCRYGRARVVLLDADAVSADAANVVRSKDIVVEGVDRFGNDPTLPFKTVFLRSSKTATGCARGVPAAASAIGPAPDAAADSGARRGDGLRLQATERSGREEIASEPAVVPTETNGQLPAVTVKWNVPGATRIEIHMKAPDGQLFAQGGGSGFAETGNWVSAGAEFFLQDVSDGEPGKTIATLVASPCRRCL